MGRWTGWCSQTCAQEWWVCLLLLAFSRQASASLSLRRVMPPSRSAWGLRGAMHVQVPGPGPGALGTLTHCPLLLASRRSGWDPARQGGADSEAWGRAGADRGPGQSEAWFQPSSAPTRCRQDSQPPGPIPAPHGSLGGVIARC